MKKSVAAVLVAVLAVAVIGVIVFALQKDKAEAPSPTASTTQEATEAPVIPSTAASVDIRDYAFTPAKITVKVGATVTWTNEDGMSHDITPDEETADFKASALFSKGESYSVTFNTAGTYTYYCSPHPYMKGTVEVVQ